MRYASAFLSHAHEDKPLVRGVADRLVRHGILPWEDINELLPGRNPPAAIKEAIKQQNAVVVFVSEASLGSPSCEDELALALDLERRQQEDEQWIIPVFDGDPLSLVLASRLLRQSHWLHPDGDRVAKLGIVDREPNIIASKIASRVYELLKLANAPEVGIVIDQRGTRRRVGLPSVPGNLGDEDMPILVYRPDQSTRTDMQVLRAKEWEAFSEDMRTSMYAALRSLRRRVTVRICGDAQHGLFFFLGHLLNRSTGVTLSCHSSDINNRASTLNNREWTRESLLQAARPSQSSLPSGGDGVSPPQEVRFGVDAPVVALLLMGARPNHYLQAAIRHIQSATEDSPQCVWLEHSPELQRTDVQQVVADVLGLVHQLRSENDTEEVRIYTDLPVNVMPLLAAQLTHKDIPRVVFMDHDHESVVNRRPRSEHYTALSMVAKLEGPAPDPH